MPALNSPSNTPLARAVAGLVRTCDLEPPYAEQLCALDLATEHYPPGAEIGPADGPPHLKWMLDGWACEARDLPDGRRQVFSFVIPGDVVRPADSSTGWRSVRALTAAQCVDVGEVIARLGEHAGALAAIERSAALAHARRYEHLSRLVWRSALARTASMLVELHDRLDAVGLVTTGAFALPLRHEDLADALGLSGLHVTRCLGALRDQGLLALQFRRVSCFDREGVQKICSG